AARDATVKARTPGAAASQGAAARAPSAPRDRWTTLPGSRLVRTEVSAARLGRFAYVLGGFDEATGQTTARVERLDLVSRRWTLGHSLPIALNHASAFAYGGDLYVLGGYASVSDTSTSATNAFW